MPPATYEMPCQESCLASTCDESKKHSRSNTIGLLSLFLEEDSVKLSGVVKTDNDGFQSEAEVEPYDGTYAGLICTNSERGQPALVCLQCTCNPWHRECNKEEKYVELCPQRDKRSVQEFKGECHSESFGTAAPSVVVDLTGEGGGGAEAAALTEHGAQEEQPEPAVGGDVMAAKVVDRGALGIRADAGNGSSGNGKEDAGAANGKRKVEEEAVARFIPQLLLPRDTSDKLKQAIGDLLHNTVDKSHLGSNLISDEGAKALAEGLKVNTAVKKLNLGNNKISDSVNKQVRTRLSCRS